MAARVSTTLKLRTILEDVNPKRVVIDLLYNRGTHNLGFKTINSVNGLKSRILFRKHSRFQPGNRVYRVRTKIVNTPIVHNSCKIPCTRLWKLR